MHRVRRVGKFLTVPWKKQSKHEQHFSLIDNLPSQYNLYCPTWLLFWSSFYLTQLLYRALLPSFCLFLAPPNLFYRISFLSDPDLCLFYSPFFLYFHLCSWFSSPFVCLVKFVKGHTVSQQCESTGYGNRTDKGMLKFSLLMLWVGVEGGLCRRGGC